MNAIAPSLDAPAPARGTVQVPWPALLGSLSAHDADALERLAQARHVAEGRRIFSRGDTAQALVALLDGQAACGWWHAERGLTAERVLHAPGWLALAGPWVHGQHGCDAVAQSHVLLVELPLEPLRAVLTRHPMLALRFSDALAREVGRLESRLHELMHKDAGARLAAWICAQFAGRAQPSVLRLAERKRDIASQLGMTPETLSRLMRSLSDRGLIAVSGYTLRVLDPQGLRGLAGA
ncbi:MAG: Crp/Fnr family transcriptional regulator [Burkholderiaceae bacterium]|nr:Crp/Fnr family transcriptional regulator [Burkholderiaceae bacterium]